MGWFNKIFKGSTQRFRLGNDHDHNGYYQSYPHDEPSADTDPDPDPDETHTQEPSTSEEDTSGQENEDIDRAIALSLIENSQGQTNNTCAANAGKYAMVDEDEQLARAIQESMVVGNTPRQKHGSSYDIGNAYGSGDVYGNGHMQHGGGNVYANGDIYYPRPTAFPMDFRICAGCNMEIGHGRYLNCLNALWHPECFRCYGCRHPISEYEFSTSGNYPFHKACYRERYHPKCDVCSLFIPTNHAGLIEYRAHPFWVQKYCPSHEHDATPRCCSCERMEPRNTGYVELNDGRKLCLECLDSAVMDTFQCQPLYLQIQEFYEGLFMKVEQDVPLLLVERQALNEAREGEKNGHYHMPETRGLCLSEEQTVSTVRKRSKHGTGNWAGNMITEPYKLTRQCEVTAILILFGLPRLLTGSILAHEMMHAWMRLKGFRTLSQDVEEGICQVMAHKWLEAELAAGSRNSNVASSSSSRGVKKGPRSQYERKLGEFFKHQIESDASPVYGDGFRAGRLAVNKYGLPKTLEHIQMTGRFPV